MKENELVNTFIKYFSTWFDIEKEVWDDTKKHRIDLILKHKQDVQIIFGVECKKPGRKRGQGIGKILKQCWV